MKIILVPIYVIYKLWVGFVFWTTLLLLYPFFALLLSKTKWFPAAFKLKRFWSRLFQLLLFCPVVPKWEGQRPEPPYIICSNHSSYLDTVFFYSVFPDYFLFIGKGELLKWPLFRLFFRKMDIPVTRENFRLAYGALSKASEAIRRGECIAIYPEGTVPVDSPRLSRFKNGAFKLAIEEQVPILPITWQTNHRILSDPNQVFSRSLPGLSKIVIHKPVDTKGLDLDDLVSLRETVFEAIESGIPEEHRRK